MISPTKKNEVIRLVREFEDGLTSPTKNVMEQEQLLYYILSPLFEHDGYILDPVMSPRDGGVDFLALEIGSDTKIGVESKILQRPVDTSTVLELASKSMEYSFSRAIMFAPSGFTKSSINTINQIAPNHLELLDLDGLKNWVSKLEIESKLKLLSHEDLIKTVNKELIRRILDDPTYLDKIEWRDFERTIAELFEGLAFKVELTPSSGDGGKDLILECTQKGNEVSYIVEIKHWRSQQRVGQDYVKDFLKVICREKRNSGLFLSTYGFTANAFEGLSEIERKKVRFGGKDKIINLCRSYMKVQTGIWSPVEDLGNLFMNETL